MQVVWSMDSKVIHRYDNGASPEECNVDAIPEHRRMKNPHVSDDLAELRLWANERVLTLCKRCFGE